MAPAAIPKRMDISRARNFLRRFWPLLLPLLVLAPGMAGFPYPGSGGDFSDLAISHYPNAIYLRDAITQFHTLPLWSPAILSGYPFFANPLSGLWYPPGWIALLLPLPFGFNLAIALHLLWAGLGAYHLVRAEGLSHRAAMFAALAYAAMPKLYAHYGAGHLTLLYAISWTPWLLLASRREADRLQKIPLKAWWMSAGRYPGLVLAAIVLADVRWGVYAGILWFAYTLFQGPGKILAAGFTYRIGRLRSRLLQLGLAAARAGAAGIYAGMLSAPLILPLIEYTRLSTRANLEAGDVLAFSLPYDRLLGLVYPDFAGFHEYMLYPGAMVLVLALLAVLWEAPRRRGRFWIVVALAGWVYALGEGLPGAESLAQLPGLSLLRVPARALFLSGFALIMLSAYSLDRVFARPTRDELRRANLGLAGLVAFALILAAAAWLMAGNLVFSLAWGGGMAFVSARWVRGSLWRFVGRSTWYAGLIGIALIDWWAIDYSLFTSRSAQEVLAEGSQVVAQLDQEREDFRTFSPSYSLPQQTAAANGFQLADGVDPLQLAAYSQFLLRAAGMPAASGYSVTLPPFATGDPSSDNRDFVPDAELLGILNVKYVIAHTELQASPDEYQLLRVAGERIYANPKARPRAWMQSSKDQVDREYSPVEEYQWRPNRIDVRATGPGTLVTSEIDYPGWRVRVDGQPAEKISLDGLLRAVELGPGQHEVAFVFRPVSLYAGLAALAIGLGLLFLTGSRAVKEGHGYD